MTPTNFGQWVARERAAQGLTRNELAKRLGCTVQALFQLERGVSDVTLGRVAKVAKALGYASFTIQFEK